MRKASLFTALGRADTSPGRNPQPHREEVTPFEPDEVEAIAAELGSTHGPLVIVAAYTGLRPSEWAALEWRDVDKSDGILRVERAFSYGVLKAPKTKGSRRRVAREGDRSA